MSSRVAVPGAVTQPHEWRRLTFAFVALLNVGVAVATRNDFRGALPALNLIVGLVILLTAVGLGISRRRRLLPVALRRVLIALPLLVVVACIGSMLFTRDFVHMVMPVATPPPPSPPGDSCGNHRLVPVTVYPDALWQLFVLDVVLALLVWNETPRPTKPKEAVQMDRRNAFATPRKGSRVVAPTIDVQPDASSAGHAPVVDNNS